MFKLFNSLILMLLPISLMAREGEAFDKKQFKKPTREYSIIATNEGFYPNKVFAYVGEKVKFFVTATSDKPQCFLIKDHEVFVGAKQGEISFGEVTFNTPGRFEYYCPSNSFKGHVTVIEKVGEKREKRKREIASKKPDYWMPRNYD